MMPVKVRCPAGHAVTCPDGRYGEVGKCPRCGSTFRVPDRPGGTAVKAQEAPKPDKQEKAAAAGDEELIVFLCPNGHKLNGPASLQGRPGQCPHCGMKFVIPDYREENAKPRAALEPEPESPEALPAEEEPVEAEETGLEDLNATEPLDGLESDLSRQVTAAPAALPEAGSESADDEPWLLPADADELEGAEPGIMMGEHPMAGIFAEFWSQRTGGGVIELHLKGGGTIAPDHYDPGLSGAEQGVFALRNVDGSFTLTAVAWDAVARISVRGVRALPPGMIG